MHKTSEELKKQRLHILSLLKDGNDGSLPTDVKEEEEFHIPSLFPRRQIDEFLARALLRVLEKVGGEQGLTVYFLGLGNGRGEKRFVDLLKSKEYSRVFGTNPPFRFVGVDPAGFHVKRGTWTKKEDLPPVVKQFFPVSYPTIPEMLKQDPAATTRPCLIWTCWPTNEGYDIAAINLLGGACVGVVGLVEGSCNAGYEGAAGSLEFNNFLLRPPSRWRQTEPPLFKLTDNADGMVRSYRSIVDDMGQEWGDRYLRETMENDTQIERFCYRHCYLAAVVRD